MRVHSRRSIRIRVCLVAWFLGGWLDHAIAQTVEPAPVETSSRPTLFVPSYAAFVALQALDVHSTHSALAAGGTEANPIVRSIGTPGMIAMKVGTTVACILVVERFRKRHPKAAAIVITSANVAMAAVVAHNYAVAGSIDRRH